MARAEATAPTRGCSRAGRRPVVFPWFLDSSLRQSSSVLPRREVVERLVQSLIVAVSDPIRDRSEGGQNR